MGASRAGVQRRRVPRPEADLVPAAHDGPRLRRQAARQRPSGVRRLALARILGAARGGDRVQARGVPPGADRAASLPADGPPRAPATRAAGGLALMERIYQALPLRELGGDAGFRRPTQPPSGRVSLESSALEVMTDLAEVERARVGHVLETLRRAGRQHVLVVDFDVLPPRRPLDAGVKRAMVRGIFSISQIARQLGVSVPAGGEVALTFSEIEAALIK